MILDCEALVGDYLRGHPDIEALNARVSGQLPKSFTNPWVKVAQLDASNATNTYDTEHLVSYYLQIDAYAGSDPQTGQGEASLLARTVREALFTMPSTSDAVISRVVVRSHAHVPDLEFEPSRERYVLDVELLAHA